ncbi:MAG TPA: hypothetical protein VF660_08855 [Actinomycetota bacterium]|jgi:UDP-N-acetylmuramyl pentapeptide phosphotransferase/UDP-N-acetylglucosamine-1-phosphate transferase
MSRTIAIVLLVLLSVAFALADTILLVRSSEQKTRNYRGVEVPVVLGIGLAAAVFGAALVVFSIALWRDKSPPLLIGVHAIVLVLACMVVFLGGLYDDRVHGPARGLVGHFRELFRGRVTPGIVKLVAAVAAAALVAWRSNTGIATAVIGIPVMAGATNLWNLLDVRPGRALKYFLPLGLVLLYSARRTDYALVAAAAMGAAVVVFPFDLGEEGMLGDAGSNLLGFVIGLGLFQVLPLWALALALIAIVAVHVASETVTLSRLIKSYRALRWYEELGAASPARDDESAWWEEKAAD